METGLTRAQLELIRSVISRFPAVEGVLLFGSRAKGDFRLESDVDLALVGVADELVAEAVADELDELPLPYHFDVKALDGIRHAPLSAHIRRVGILLYQRDPVGQQSPCC